MINYRAPDPEFSVIGYLKSWLLDDKRDERARNADCYSFTTLNRGQISLSEPHYTPPHPEHDRNTPLNFLRAETDLDSRRAIYRFMTKAATQNEINEIKAYALEVMVNAHSVVMVADEMSGLITKEKADCSESA